jgi:hypothetical protein
MAAKGRRAGQNIRQLALKRRIKAISSFISAVLVIAVPLLYINILKDFFKQLINNSASQEQSTLNIPPILYIVLIIIALCLVANGIVLWRRANRADQGAKGEEIISLELSQLEQEGWKIEYGMRLGNRLGDADIVCLSPQNKAYVIDVKSHKGKVTTDGTSLQRWIGKKSYPFEKDFIAQIMKQALQVRKQKSFKFVTPILAFSSAKLSIPSDQLRKVYIVEKSRLISLLKSLG